MKPDREGEARWAADEAEVTRPLKHDRAAENEGVAVGRLRLIMTRAVEGADPVVEVVERDE